MSKYKKIISISIIMCMLLSITSTVFSATITLEQIVNKVNSSNYGAYFMEDSYGFSEPMNMNIQAEILGNKIKVSCSLSTQSNPSEKIESEIEYVLNGNILSSTIDIFEGVNTEDLNDTMDSMIYILLKSNMLMSVIDSVGQLNEYAKGEFIKILNKDEAKNYTIENEGIELKQPSESSIQVKIDLSKKLEFEENGTTENPPNDSSNNDSSNSNSNNNTNNNQTQNDTSKDTTTIQNVLPKAGTSSIISICISIFFVLALISFICYKKYKM